MAKHTPEQPRSEKPRVQRMNDAAKAAVIGRIRNEADTMRVSIKAKKKPEMAFPLRALSNVSYDKKKGHFMIGRKKAIRTLSYTTVKTFAMSVRLLALSKNLVETNDIATKRDVYYQTKNWEEAGATDQTESDTIMDDTEAMLGFNREQMGFIPDEHGGAISGRLTVIDRDSSNGQTLRLDCTKFGSGAYTVPPSVEHLKFETSAKFILAIETTGMFQRLNHHAYWDTANCVLVAMGGVPSRACRRFIRKLSDEHKLPVYVFTDGDPYGYANIYRTLKVGSGNAAHLNEFFCVPQAVYLGVTPQDIQDYKLPTHELKDVDVKRAKDAMKNDPFFYSHKEWIQALEQMIKMEVRAEQQALAKWGLNYVIDTYLPEKLKNHKTFLP